MKTLSNSSGSGFNTGLGRSGKREVCIIARRAMISTYSIKLLIIHLFFFQVLPWYRFRPWYWYR
jgi:hypothetical protein